jgi:hypothetical protein
VAWLWARRYERREREAALRTREQRLADWRLVEFPEAAQTFPQPGTTPFGSARESRLHEGAEFERLRHFFGAYFHQDWELDDEDGVIRLRLLARHAEVTGLCSCGCPTFSLSVDKSQCSPAEIDPRASVKHAHSDDLDPPIDLLLFARGGWLEAVELVWYGDAPPSSFPPLSHFKHAR